MPTLLATETNFAVQISNPAFYCLLALIAIYLFRDSIRKFRIKTSMLEFESERSDQEDVLGQELEKKKKAKLPELP